MCSQSYCQDYLEKGTNLTKQSIVVFNKLLLTLYKQKSYCKAKFLGFKAHIDFQFLFNYTIQNQTTKWSLKMLVLSRKKDEQIILKGENFKDIKITVVRIDNYNKVRIGIEADQGVSILRSELEQRSPEKSPIPTNH
jgi:carbon storage regulator CsrA